MNNMYHNFSEFKRFVIGPRTPFLKIALEIFDKNGPEVFSEFISLLSDEAKAELQKQKDEMEAFMLEQRIASSFWEMAMNKLSLMGFGNN